VSHFSAPDGVDTQIFVEDHEEVIKPALAEPFVLELGVVIVRGVGLGLNVNAGHVNRPHQRRLG